VRRVAAMFLFGGLVFALAGCGGGSDSGAQATVTVTTTETVSTETTRMDLNGNTTGTTTTETSASSGGLAPVTAETCAALRSVLSDLDAAATLGGGWDYVNVAAAMDAFADHVQVPAEVADSVKTARAFVDLAASAYEDAGVAPNATPLPDQMDKINESESQVPADTTRALRTLDVWTGNDCG
jgi:hypothetical protein